MLNNGKIEICPLAFMRGRTFKDSLIIGDEMQNSSPNQMKMLTTRIGENCKMVITGDLNQTDILKENGLRDFISKLRHYELYNRNYIAHTTTTTHDTPDNYTTTNYSHPKIKRIDTILFDKNDVERSEIVKHIIEIYDFKDEATIIDEVRLVKNINLHELNNTNKNLLYDLKTQQYICFNNTSLNNNKPDAALIPTEYVTKNYNKFLDSMKNF